MRNTKWSLSLTHATKASAWSTSFIGRAGLILTEPGSWFPTWEMLPMLFRTSMPLTLLCRVACRVFPLLISFSFSAMSGHHLPSLRLHCLIAWKSILRRGAVLHTLHPPWYSLSFPFRTTLCCFSPDHVRHAVQARLSRKHCRHDIGLGPYLLSMTSSPLAPVAVPGFSSFHFCFAPLISASFSIRRYLPLTQLLFRYWLPPVA